MMDLDEALGVLGDKGAKALCESRHHQADPCTVCRLEAAVVLADVLGDAAVGETTSGWPIVTVPVGWRFNYSRLEPESVPE